MERNLIEAVERSCLPIVEVGSIFRMKSHTVAAERTSHVTLTVHQVVNICLVMSRLTVPEAEMTSPLVQTMKDVRYQTEAYTTSLKLMMIKEARCSKWHVQHLIHDKIKEKKAGIRPTASKGIKGT